MTALAWSTEIRRLRSFAPARNPAERGRPPTRPSTTPCPPAAPSPAASRRPTAGEVVAVLADMVSSPWAELSEANANGERSVEGALRAAAADRERAAGLAPGGPAELRGPHRAVAGHRARCSPGYRDMMPKVVASGVRPRVHRSNSSGRLSRAS